MPGVLCERCRQWREASAPGSQLCDTCSALPPKPHVSPLPLHSDERYIVAVVACGAWLALATIGLSVLLYHFWYAYWNWLWSLSWYWWPVVAIGTTIADLLVIGLVGLVPVLLWKGLTGRNPFPDT
jgi:hypothetical protein